MHRHQCKDTGIVKTQGNMTPPKETNKAPVMDPEYLKIYGMSDKEFRIILLEKLGNHKKTQIENYIKFGKLSRNKIEHWTKK